MKNAITTLFFVLVTLYSFAQKTIENPEYGYSTFPGEILKIELNDTATVMHFKLKEFPWGYFHLHEEAYIVPENDKNKLFVTKVRGANYGRNDFPDSGKVTYQLYFPPLDTAVTTFDFGVDVERGWQVYNIILQEDKNVVHLPKLLRGNWLLANGSNRWDYGLNSTNAIIEGQVWGYKSVDRKGKKYTIILEKDSEVKTIYGKLEKNGKVAFGDLPKSLRDYTLKPIFNPKYEMENDEPFETLEFSMGTATYSGYIKGFSSRIKQKTGVLHVNNFFIGNQESNLIKINDDGSFKVVVPITHPQTVYITMPTGRYYVFLEPNKETCHYIDNKNSFFMGDNAIVNSNLQELKEIRIMLSRKHRNEIGEASPEDYTKQCLMLKEQVLAKLARQTKQNFISKKALQIKEIEIELGYYQMLLSYNMYRRSVKYKNGKAKKEEDILPFKEFDVNEDYYDFLPKSIVDNTLLTLSNNYYFFINRLSFADIFNLYGRSSSLKSRLEQANWLQKLGITLTAEELKMVELSKAIDTPEKLTRIKEFDKKHGYTRQQFYSNYREHFNNTSDYIKENALPKQDFVISVAEYLQSVNIDISEEESKMVNALKVLKSKEEREQESLFNEQFTDVIKSFSNKFSDNASAIWRARNLAAKTEKLQEFFGTEHSFVQDAIKSQTICQTFEDYKVLNNEALVHVQETIHTPFIKEYIAFCNEQTKKKIEFNKTKGGYTVHNVEKSKGDELFDALIKKFRGKVVYVDFWATWCGPCKSGIQSIAPLKEEMNEEDVVFIYITDQSSPENTWKNAIANIKGEHYRVSTDEWNYLKEKFNISGIPHYTLVDKKGSVVKEKLGHLSNNKLKTLLLEEVAK